MSISSNYWKFRWINKWDMKQLLRNVYNLLAIFGIDPRKSIHSIRTMPHYLRNLHSLKNQKTFAAREFHFGKPYPCLDDRFSKRGEAKGYYFHQGICW